MVKKRERKDASSINTTNVGIEDIKVMGEDILNTMKIIVEALPHTYNEEIGKLLDYKKGCEILIKHYSNVVEMNTNVDKIAYNTAMEKMVRISAIDTKIRKRIEGLILKEYGEENIA